MLTAAGPLQTMISGTIGLLMLLLTRSSFAGKEQLSPWQWVLIFMTLFWLREIFNLVFELL